MKDNEMMPSASPAALTDEQRKALEAAIHDYEERGFNRMPCVLQSILAAQPAAPAPADRQGVALSDNCSIREEEQ